MDEFATLSAGNRLMGKTLNFVCHILSDVRRLLDINQPRHALRLLRGLAGVADLPEAPGGEIYYLLGEVHLNLGQYRLARRYLRRALRLVPLDAQALYDMARAVECDPHMDASHAARYYNRAIELSPQSVCLLVDAGAYFVQLGREKKGLALLARAVELAPNDIETLQTYVECLCDARQFAQARRVLDVARFALRSKSMVAQLRDRIEFHEAHQTQEHAPHRGQSAIAEPVLLPYLRVVSDEPMSVRGAKYRRDQASKARPHLFSGKHRFDTGRSG
jgi:tetratricopeptide (TPR) repeat protein